MIEVDWGGETFVATAERALWWARRRTLCVADLHLGKAATFRQAGIPVPESTCRSTMERLEGTVSRWDPQRLVVLGDLLHSRNGREAGTMSLFAEWRRTRPDLGVLLIRGNHDRHAGDPPADWSIRVESEPYCEPGDGAVCFAHDPRTAEKAARGAAILCGHLHPGVLLSGTMRDMRAACFWFGRLPRVGVLPAFGTFTGMKLVRPVEGDRVLAVGPGGILDITPVPIARA